MDMIMKLILYKEESTSLYFNVIICLPGSFNWEQLLQNFEKSDWTITCSFTIHHGFWCTDNKGKLPQLMSMFQTPSTGLYTQWFLYL
jgi:hypothetical protein